ncbi:IQ and ubiquitin-like domain-containing protein [Belonocnema kinseyi]|uniref:IQ and ubiquitin-like domain-containing protein n=1 Tax=Belonocnema kinseyi TaxID=2817044 RepID=UPI00143D9FF6|nr:IQ and ubiquitin-like domain-containing protein [Belonocnema kinseyi]
MVVMDQKEERIKKPFLGGWRHKLNGTEFLNAESQTGPPPKKSPWSCMLSKEVQCVETRENFTQPPRHRATQMWRTDCYIPSETDKYLSIKTYESYEEMQRRINIEGHARTIQRYYRAYRIRRFIKESAQLYRKLLGDCRLEEEEKEAKIQKRFQDEIFRKTYPKTRMDFDMLYNLIDNWRVIQFSQIKKQFFKAGQLAVQYSVLETTVSMLKNVDSLRQVVRDSYRTKKQAKFLKIHCQPLKWKGYKGKSIEMVTLKTQKAREYKILYDDLKNDDVTFEERIEILLNVKNFLIKYDGYAVEELNYLMDQELIFLDRRIEGLVLDNLRKRTISTFLHFLRKSNFYSCKFRSENTLKDQSFHELREPLETETLLCRSCKKLLPRNKFSVHVRMKTFLHCKSCAWLTKKRNIPHVNYDPYSFMLREIRSEEQRMNCFSSLAYVMQEPDIYHLINHTWHGRSIVSENNDLYTLRLIRFDIKAEWAPWNCILLTEDEAKTHYHIKKVESLYSKRLLQSIYLNHQMAKSIFKNLITIETQFRESGRYYLIQNNRDFQPTLTAERYENRIK